MLDVYDICENVSKHCDNKTFFAICCINKLFWKYNQQYLLELEKQQFIENMLYYQTIYKNTHYDNECKDKIITNIYYLLDRHNHCFEMSFDNHLISNSIECFVERSKRFKGMDLFVVYLIKKDIKTLFEIIY